MASPSAAELSSGRLHASACCAVRVRTRRPIARRQRALQRKPIMANTTTGTIKRLTDKGFGFIAAGDGTEYFFHQSAVQGARYDDLREGQRVSFESVRPE
jgi:cold shock protein